MQATPSTWRLLLSAGWNGGKHFKVLCGGEAMPKDLMRELVYRNGQCFGICMVLLRQRFGLPVFVLIMLMILFL